MTVESTAPTLAVAHATPKRAWTTPLVIESSDVSETKAGGAQAPNDASYQPNVVAS